MSLDTALPDGKPGQALWGLCRHSCTTRQPGHHFSFSASPFSDGRASYGQITGPSTPRCSWSQTSTLLLFLETIPALEPTSRDFLGQEAKNGYRPANPWQKRMRGRGCCSAWAAASREGLASTSGYLRGGPTQGEACPCRECPHFIYSPSLT